MDYAASQHAPAKAGAYALAPQFASFTGSKVGRQEHCCLDQAPAECSSGSEAVGGWRAGDGTQCRQTTVGSDAESADLVITRV